MLYEFNNNITGKHLHTSNICIIRTQHIYIEQVMELSEFKFMSRLNHMLGKNRVDNTKYNLHFTDIFSHFYYFYFQNF